MGNYNLGGFFGENFLNKGALKQYFIKYHSSGLLS